MVHQLAVLNRRCSKKTREGSDVREVRSDVIEPFAALAQARANRANKENSINVLKNVRDKKEMGGFEALAGLNARSARVVKRYYGRLRDQDGHHFTDIAYRSKNIRDKKQKKEMKGLEALAGLKAVSTRDEKEKESSFGRLGPIVRRMPTEEGFRFMLQARHVDDYGGHDDSGDY